FLFFKKSDWKFFKPASIRDWSGMDNAAPTSFVKEKDTMIKKFVPVTTDKSAKSAGNSNSETTIQTDVKFKISSKNFPADWQKQVARIIGGMREYKIDFGGDRNPDGLQARQNTLIDLDRQIIELKMRLDQLRDDRKQKRSEVYQLALSTRHAVSG